MFSVGLKVIAVIAVFIWQISFVSSLPWPWFYFNFIIITLVTLLLVADFSAVSWAALLSAVLLDIYSADFFGLNIISLLGAAVVTYFSLLKFFTNRSLYSFIFLTLIATTSYEIFKASLQWLAHFIGSNGQTQFIFSRYNFIHWGYEAAANMVAILIIFYLINYFSRRLKAFFIR